MKWLMSYTIVFKGHKILTERGFNLKIFFNSISVDLIYSNAQLFDLVIDFIEFMGKFVHLSCTRVTYILDFSLVGGKDNRREIQ